MSGSPELDAAIAGLFGLLVGSFLNVVIYRLPVMLERQWGAEAAEIAASATTAADASQPGAIDAVSAEPAESLDAPEPVEPFNLLTPRSRCRHCGHAIRWYENIPVVSWLALRGRCSQCRTRISVRYPLVELATGGLFAWISWRWGVTTTALAWSGFAAALVALAMIDWDTTLLPDDITLPLVWAGLLAAALRWTQVPLAEAVWGGALGYLSLWAIYHLFKAITGKEGMGYGDFKLFAALGTWFGASALVPIILMSSVIGAVVGIALKFSSGLREGGYVPFGPFLAGAGLTAMAFGPGAILKAVGLD